jgi:acyl-coenzyme A synthetase/AMP-(fatty) acid ligase
MARMRALVMDPPTQRHVDWTDATMLRQHVRTRLGRMSAPRVVRLVDALPANAAGNLPRRVVAALMLGNGVAGGPAG